MNIQKFLLLILCTISNLTLAKPFEDEKSFNDENKLNCMDTNDATEYDKSNQNPFSNLYKTHNKFDSDKYLDRYANYGKKRSTESFYETNALQKRQVGVVYKEDRPIGILQPFQRSYRFIPVKEENDYSLSARPDEIAGNLANIEELEKREIGGFDNSLIDESYPSILANFKIGRKLDRKRNYDSLAGNYESLNDDNVRDLKSTIRRLRSSNPHNSEKIEEELKNILDDMGLIDDDELHGEKREISSENEELNKRDDSLENNKSEEKQDESKKQEDDLKRQKRDQLEKEDLVEKLKDSGNLMLSGNESPLAVSSEIVTRDVHKSDEDYEKVIEHQIQSKLDSLKEEVKREIEEAYNNNDDEDEEKRRKRQIYDNLISEETDELNPALNVDTDLKPLIRRRRKVNYDVPNYKMKRRIVRSPENLKDKNVRNIHADENENEKDILGGDDIEDESSKVVKRSAYNVNENSKYGRNFRSGSLLRDYLYNNYFHGNPVRLKRQNLLQNNFDRFGNWKDRFRRRIDDNSFGNRPQQLSDMSDLDLFGALPKSYDGELSRYKRVKKEIN